MTAAVVPLTVAGIAFATGTPARATPTTANATADRTSPAEASLVDHIPAPVLHWTPCQQTFQCATANLPRDYHNPHGPTVRIALLRLPATDPAHRLGSVFTNPGGPGDSGTDFVAQNASFLPESLLDQFDVIGVDPRGVGASQPIQCFADQTHQTQVESTLNTQHFLYRAKTSRSAGDLLFCSRVRPLVGTR